MSYRLFLDDDRNPKDCLSYMHTRIGPKNFAYLEEWVVVRNYDEFVQAIKERGLPSLVSFDHDLSADHLGIGFENEAWEDYQRWDGREMTGYDCANFLREYCYWNKLELPEWFVHSMNPVGRERITSLLNTPEYGRK